MTRYLTALEIKLYLRDGAGVFWTFIYPFILLFSLGFIFSGKESHFDKFDIEVVSEKSREVTQPYLNGLQSVFEKSGQQLAFSFPNSVDPPKSARLELRSSTDNKIDEVTLTYFKLSPAEQWVLKQHILRANEQYHRLLRNETLGTILTVKDLEKEQVTINYALFLVSGVAALTIFSISLFGFAVPLVAQREAGALKNYQYFPVGKSDYLLAFVVSRLLILTLFILAFVSISNFIFNGPRITLYTYLNMIVYLLVGISAFLSVGFVLASAFEKLSTLNAVVNLINLPVMFLSNALIPVNNMPEAAAKILQYLPTNLFVDGFRGILHHNQGLSGVLLNISVLLFCIVICAYISRKSFRWNN